MLIDWFTVAAQIVNFVVLVWLLRRFLYKPVLDAIEAREAGIASQLASAAAERQTAREERERYEARNAAIQRERSDLLGAARSAAEAERHELLQQAGIEHERLRSRFATELTAEREDIARSVVTAAIAESLSTTRKILADIAGETLENRIVESFVGRLGTLPEAERSELRSHLAGDDRNASPAPSIRIRSAFELTAAQRTTLERGLLAAVPGHGALQYEIAAELIGGMELLVNGYCLRWSVEAYVARLHERVDAELARAVGK